MLNSNQKLKIIYLISELGKGGSERQLYLLLKYMDFNAAEASVLVFNPSKLTDYAENIQTLGVRVVQMPPSQTSIIKKLMWLFQFLWKEKPDVVHSWSTPDNPYAGIAGLLARVPLRLGSFRNSLANRSFLALSPFFRNLAIRACPYLVVNARSIEEELLTFGISEAKLFFLENCVEMANDLGKVDLPTELTDSYRLVGTVCNIRRNKNVHVFVEGISLLTEKFPDLRGLIVGQPIPDELVYYQFIQSLIRDKKLTEKIVMLGFRDDAPQLVREFEIFCLLSDFEGSPNAILEAMAAGRPVIGSNIGGIPDMVEDGVTGYLVPPGDAAAFADALEKMLNDPDLTHMGAAGRKRVESNCQCEKSAARLLNLYQQLLTREK